MADLIPGEGHGWDDTTMMRRSGVTAKGGELFRSSLGRGTRSESRAILGFVKANPTFVYQGRGECKEGC
jgi:hypothetical protein